MRARACRSHSPLPHAPLRRNRASCFQAVKPGHGIDRGPGRIGRRDFEGKGLAVVRQNDRWWQTKIGLLKLSSRLGLSLSIVGAIIYMGRTCVDQDAAKMDELIAARKYDEIEKFIELLGCRSYGDSELRAHNYYVVGNGYAALSDRLKSPWSERSGLQVKFFKKALYEPGFSALSSDLRSRVYTNLANALCRQGRYLEAVVEYDRAIAIFNNPVAFLCKGQALLEFSRGLYDEGHGIYFQKEAYPILKYVYEHKENLFDKDHLATMNAARHLIDFIQYFDENFEEICEAFPHLSTIQGQVGKSQKERLYKQWCLENRLFINDLNEISNDPVAARDVMSTPSVRYSINPLVGVAESLWLSGGFSEIKHQYAHARFTYFEAIDSKYAKKEISHYASHDLFLTNSLDYCLYRRDIEQIKICFRLLYSCFDKLAVLLYKYLEPGSTARVHFSNVWYVSGKVIRDRFLDSENPFLLALYWLSREINDNEAEGHDHWMDPNAGKLADIRNKMEHSGFKVVVDDLYKITRAFELQCENEKYAEILIRIKECERVLKGGVPKAEQKKIKLKIAADQALLEGKENLKGYPLVITDKELRNQTLRLMRKVRYAMVYTSLAIYYEEERRDKSGIAIPYETPIY
ncbi:LA2681 family HEPN domain-containing protein [Pseudomonas sp. zfem005]|uniref:LA2681 family HEPN domain-containing protein n=1 Tax=Pseudomonas sp. zfem005 TaxID=3078200 RepID=UPI0029286B44|nr:LA2681 family HEPN domain-containing protein [Pseudomonas sp. zfem005]MDU9414893.1 LA2681 family HEPN domain-containing protein [Pseudomonas sp. zfem005]